MDTIVIQNCKNFIHEITNFMCEPHTKKLEELEMGLDNITFDFILNIMQTYAESLDKKIKPIKSGEEKDKS